MMHEDGSEELTDALIQPLIPKEHMGVGLKGSNSYPGSRRLIQKKHLPKNLALIKTGGNALQAVDRSLMHKNNLIAVAVPDCDVKGGDPMIVVAPDGSGRAITVVVPEECSAGHVFFVDFSSFSPIPGIPVTKSIEPSVAIVNGISPSQQPEKDLEFFEESRLNKIENDLFLVAIPEASKPGQKIQVALPDKRIVEVIIPEGDAKQIYVRTPRKNSIDDSTSLVLNGGELHQIV